MIHTVGRYRPRGKTSRSRHQKHDTHHSTWFSTPMYSSTVGSNPDVSRSRYESHSNESYGGRSLDFHEGYYPRRDGVAYAGIFLAGAARADLYQRVSESLS